jgi:hypothetical protein
LIFDGCLKFYDNKPNMKETDWRTVRIKNLKREWLGFVECNVQSNLRLTSSYGILQDVTFDSKRSFDSRLPYSTKVKLHSNSGFATIHSYYFLSVAKNRK